jgi:hypothetical protein
MFTWISNDVGRAALIIMIIVCPLVAVAQTWRFLAQLWREYASSHK